MTAGDKWLSVRLLIESIHRRNTPAPGLFEDQIVVVRAASIDEARQKAEREAKQREPRDRYKSATGDKISWRFKEILDGNELLDATIGDGTEIYYAYLKPEEADQLRKMLQPFKD